MDLRQAYQILELSVGASEDAVRDARKLLAKVWHPDRHANDPELQKKAEQKLSDVNAAFEVIRAAKFPSSLPEAEPQPDRHPGPSPARSHTPPSSSSGSPPPPASPAPPEQPETRPEAKAPIAAGQQRRVHWSVLLLLLCATGVATCLAIVELTAKVQAVAVQEPLRRDRSIQLPSVDEPSVSIDDGPGEAPPRVVPPEGSTPVEPQLEPVTGSFSLGSTRDQVLAVQGSPTGRSTASSTVSSSVSATERTERSWHSFSRRSTTSLEPELDERAGTSSLGSTRSQASAVQGTRTSSSTVSTETWSYGSSTVDFDPETGRVIGWWQLDRPLRVRLLPRDPVAAAKAKAAGGFTRGAAKDEVIAVQGTPTRISRMVHETWTYGTATQIEFDDAGRVISWVESDVRLRLR